MRIYASDVRVSAPSPPRDLVGSRRALGLALRTAGGHLNPRYHILVDFLKSAILSPPYPNFTTAYPPHIRTLLK